MESSELWTENGSTMLTHIYHYLSEQSHQLASFSCTWGKISYNDFCKKKLIKNYSCLIFFIFNLQKVRKQQCATNLFPSLLMLMWF
jgi:hypothetical protein